MGKIFPNSRNTIGLFQRLPGGFGSAFDGSADDRHGADEAGAGVKIIATQSVNETVEAVRDRADNGVRRVACEVKRGLDVVGGPGRLVNIGCRDGIVTGSNGFARAIF